MGLWTQWRAGVSGGCLTGPGAIGRVLIFAGCETQGPAEQAGLQIDQATQQAGDKAKEAGTAVGDKIKKAGDYLDDAAITAKIKGDIMS